MEPISRRTFLERTGTAVAVATTLPHVAAAGAADAPPAPQTTIRLTVNGSPREIAVEDRSTLAEVLRDQLDLTGTKIGCNRGECGACTVLLDGKPVYSCSQLAVWVDGRSIQTVEGLAPQGHLSPLQDAFVEHDGPQCGFCTSGQLMAATALLAANPTPTPAEARAAMTGNLCRCSNYNRYIEAVVATGGRSAPPHASTEGLPPLAVVGRPAPRIDAVERSTGAAAYTDDVKLPGMLYAQVLRSPHPHARIRRIDTSRAQALPGVRAILTHETTQIVWGAGSVAGGRQYSDQIKKITKHKRPIFSNPVRFVGEPVAAVAAVDRHIAEDALHLIDVEYEPLPFVLDHDAALEPGAPLVWPEGNLALDAKNEPQPMVATEGDVGAGFAAADRVFEDRFTTTFVHNAQLEPRAAVASWDGDSLTLYTPTQGISNCRTDTARDLGIPAENVRVICHYMGGGFGNKNQNQDADLIAAALARAAGSPVKLELSRYEDFVGVHGRWPTTQKYRVGVTHDGTLTAIALDGVSGMGPYHKSSGAIGGMDLYQVANTSSVIRPVHTNKTVSANFRGPEFPQGFYGIQSMMDSVADQLGLDPVEFVLKNMARTGRGGVPFTNYTLEQCVRRGAEAFGWQRRWHKPGADPGPVKRGVGMAFMVFRSLVGRSSAVIKLDARGRYAVHVGVTDVGAGAKTTMAMIAAEALGVPLSSIDLVWGDTDTCPYSVGESGSRTTIQTGDAVIAAARDLRQQIAAKGMPTGDTVLIASQTPTERVEGKTRDAFGAHFVEVEADVELGRVHVTEYLAVHDAGRLMNPLTAASQIKGGAIMGIGMALHEDLIYDRRSGKPLTAGFYGARLSTHLDAPDVDVIFIETDDGYGPYGAKSIGESGKVPAVAAVANAVYNAIGRRVKDLPITRDKILGALA